MSSQEKLGHTALLAAIDGKIFIHFYLAPAHFMGKQRSSIQDSGIPELRCLNFGWRKQNFGLTIDLDLMTHLENIFGL